MKKEELEALSPDELIELSEKNPLEDFASRSEIYRTAFEKYKAAGDAEKQENMKREIAICDLMAFDAPQERFGPMVVWNNEDGTETKYPDLKRDFPREAIEYYQQRVDATANVVAKARYADVVWELDRNAECARKAVSACLDAAALYLTDQEKNLELGDALDRAMAISVSINDAPLIQTVFTKHLEILEKLLEQERHRAVFDVTKSIINQIKKIEGVDTAVIVRALETSIAFYKGGGDTFHFQQPRLNLLIELYRATKDETMVAKTKLRLAQSIEEEAEWKKVNYPSGNLVAANFYGEAIKVYAELKEDAKVDELKNKMRDAYAASAEKEMVELSGKIDVPNEPIEKHLAIYQKHPLIEQLQMMAIDKNLIPSYEQAGKQAEEQEKKTVFQHLAPLSLMRGNSIVRRIETPDDKHAYTTIQNFQLGYEMVRGLLIDKIFDMAEEDPQFLNTLMQLLKDASAVQEYRLEIIKNGIENYLRGDYISAAHVLVFQLEGVLRDFLGKLGVPTFTYVNGEMRERLIDDVLRMLGKIEGMDLNFIKFMEIFLCDNRGENYRNELAHGLLKKEAFTKPKVRYLLFFLLRLCSYSVTPKAQEKPDAM